MTKFTFTLSCIFLFRLDAIPQKSKKELKKEKKRKRKEEKARKKQEKKEQKGKKSKKVKSAGEPKKPKTPFLYFSMSQRKAVQEADPSLDFGALNKKLGELWKALDADGRREYEEQGNADRQRYEREMTAAGLKGMRVNGWTGCGEWKYIGSCLSCLDLFMCSLEFSLL